MKPNHTAKFFISARLASLYEIILIPGSINVNVCLQAYIFLVVANCCNRADNMFAGEVIRLFCMF